ncbi:hypothetical protein GGP41_002403 [Bipolaris sorokiniana]|uniref:Rhodopsin domain-containing protein n=2 Tax=Cochliobolus sativus TaxID=45130 RepID=A0A8H6DXH0_COCSA|nr:uncharacterized protein COCSADRAFT_122489 [Bipolaris sorokiniana ND90Pr]EMD62127.1 hypothetical protein COCSADRAFT_122489 [Bipolaris sorokiniana ND90Pr]KAF5850125.1 hypothetical protein GGP41_002403 [Bipolaris sorokiniana]
MSGFPPPPNLDPKLEKESLAPAGLAVTIVFTVASCTTVALRLYTRKILLRHVTSDDYAILLAQIFGLGLTAINIVCFTVGGIGRHIQFVMDKLPMFLKLVYSAMAVYNATQIATKISLMLQYRHIFPSSTMRAICNWSVAFLIAWGIAQQIYTSFACGIAQLIYPKTVACIRPDIPFLLNGAMNMVTDFAILMVPIKPVVQLQINKLRKAYLLIVLCLGLVVCVISAVRLAQQVHVNKNITDGTWIMATTAMLSIVETNLGIMCACVPTLRPLVKRIAPVLLGSSNKDSSAYGNAYGNAYGQRTRLDDEQNTKSGPGSSIYIQKEVKFHSTTELRNLSSNPRDPYAIDDRSSDEISLEQAAGVTATSSRA